MDLFRAQTAQTQEMFQEETLSRVLGKEKAGELLRVKQSVLLRDDKIGIPKVEELKLLRVEKLENQAGNGNRY